MMMIDKDDVKEEEEEEEEEEMKTKEGTFESTVKLHSIVSGGRRNRGYIHGRHLLRSKCRRKSKATK
jgi:hypothetical protein